MVTNVKPLLGNAVTQPVQIDFWLRFGRLGNEANYCFFLLSPAWRLMGQMGLSLRFYENLVNTWRRWCSNTIGVSNSRLRVPLVVASIFQLGIHWVRDILIHLLYVNDFCKFDLWFGNTHKSEATSVGVCLLKRQHQHLLFALLNVRKGRGLNYGLSL